MKDNVNLFLNESETLKKVVNKDSTYWEGFVDSTKSLLQELIKIVDVSALDVTYDDGNYDPYPPTITYKKLLEISCDCNEYRINNDKVYTIKEVISFIKTIK